MSHVTTVNLDVRDLDALQVAAADLGGELVRDVSTFKWYGRSVGDAPLPEGFTVDDLGKCEHVIRFPPDAKGRPGYEVGICRRRDGRPGYVPLWDSWGPGRHIADRIGNDGGLLKQAYAAEVARKQLALQGFTVARTRNPQTGALVLTATGGRGPTVQERYGEPGLRMIGGAS